MGAATHNSTAQEIRMFGSTNCVKCENSAFKLQEISVKGAKYKMFAVQCVSCSTAFGVTEYYDNGSLLKKQETAIADLARKIDYLQSTVGQIAQLMRR
jgi:predicted nucleic-acid-binding Zn-ribbon protein